MKNYKFLIAIMHDAIVASMTVGLAIIFRMGRNLSEIEPSLILKMTLIFFCISTPVFLLFKLYRGVWHYASLDDLTQIVKAATVSILVFFMTMYLLQFVDQVPRSILVIQWFLLIVMLGGARFTFRLLHHRGRGSGGHKDGRTVPVLLLGLSDGAEQFIRATRGPLRDLYRVVGILDDVDAAGRAVHGVSVLGKVSDLSRICAQLAARGQQPERLVITDTAAAIDHDARRQLLVEADKLGLTVACLPRLADLKDTSADGTLDLNPIALEDLLGRPQTALDQAAIGQLISGRRVLVTGAGGTIGSELSRQIAALHPSELVLLDFSEFNLYNIEIELREQLPTATIWPVLCNIRSRKAVMQVFQAHHPELVFHAAALKHVPMVERNPAEGVLTNVIGTRNLADAAQRFGVLAMVQVSTDKAINPTSMMGATKRLAEFYCQSLDLSNGNGAKLDTVEPRFMTVRFGNVLGSSGSVVPLFQRQLTKGGPLTVTHPDMSRYFMTVREAVELVLQASAHGIANPSERGQIFVLDMGDPIKIVDIARQMIRLAGLRPDVDIQIKFTGLRPGEKLYEELFDDAEQRQPEAVPGIQLATSRSINTEILQRVFTDLETAGEDYDEDAIRRLITHVIPGFGGTGVDSVDSDAGPVEMSGRSDVHGSR